jgi:hypothetical protein
MSSHGKPRSLAAFIAVFIVSIFTLLSPGPLARAATTTDVQWNFNQIVAPSTAGKAHAVDITAMFPAASDGQTIMFGMQTNRFFTDTNNTLSISNQILPGYLYRVTYTPTPDQVHGKNPITFTNLFPTTLTNHEFVSGGNTNYIVNLVYAVIPVSAPGAIFLARHDDSGSNMTFVGKTMLTANAGTVGYVWTSTNADGSGDWEPPTGGGGGGGNVSGPVSSTANNLAAWNNSLGTVLKDSGVPIANVVLQALFQSFTNTLGGSAFKSTNTFDLAGTGVASATAATNAIGIPSGLAAYRSTNSFDAVGAGTTAATAATNGFPWGVLYDAAGSAAVKADTNSPTIWSPTLSGTITENGYVDASGDTYNARLGITNGSTEKLILGVLNGGGFVGPIVSGMHTNTGKNFPGITIMGLITPSLDLSNKAPIVSILAADMGANPDTQSPFQFNYATLTNRTLFGVGEEKVTGDPRYWFIVTKWSEYASNNFAVLSNLFVGQTVSSDTLIVTNGSTNLSLTASALVQTDANKKYSSVANGNGFLTNNGSGVFGIFPFASLPGASSGGNYSTNSDGSFVFTGPGVFNSAVTNKSVAAGSMLKVDANQKVVAAVQDTDYQRPISGTAFQITYSAGVLSLPNLVAFPQDIGVTRNLEVDGNQTNAGTLSNLGNQTNFSDTYLRGATVLTGGVTNSALTASTLVQADANKKISSIANGNGFLTNNGSGGFGIFPFASLPGVGSGGNFSTNSDGSFSFTGPGVFTGPFTNNSLTASTILEADANKKVISLANGAGVLTNNGSGVAGYDNTFAHTNQMLGTTSLGNVPAPAAFDSATNLYPVTVYTNFLAATNLSIVFDGFTHRATVTNGPNIYFNWTGSNGCWIFDVQTNAQLVSTTTFSKFLAGSNGVTAGIYKITNGLFSVSSYGGTNATQLKPAILEY